MQYLFYILLIPFFYLNYKIIVSDIKYKIIPNKYLGYLLLLIPFWWMIFFNNTFPSSLPLGINEGEIDILLFIGQVILTFIISFILYSFGIWSAGDAKYLLVLSLFIPHIGVIPFIGNIALLTIAYLLLYFIWFYFGKCIFYKGYAKGLWGNIKQDLGDKWINYKSNKGGKTFFIILKWLVVFLIIFVSIRLFRIYLFNEIFTGEVSQIELISGIIEAYGFYLLLGLIIIFIGLLYIFILGINKIRTIIGEEMGLNTKRVGNIFIIFLFIGLVYFIYLEYLINNKEIINYLHRIFTLYISIYVFVKIMIYSYKITFGIAEQELIDINDLKVGDIVDKEYLKKILNSKNPENKISIDNYNYNINYIQKFKNPTNLNTILKLKSIFKKTNNICISDKSIKIGFNTIKDIKILKTFPLAPYILASFIITFIFHNYLIMLIIKKIMLYLNNFAVY